MAIESRVSYYIDKYGVFRQILRNSENISKFKETIPFKPTSTWLRLIVMFWNVRVMKTAFRFGLAALIMNQYERLGFAALLLCFAL